MGASDPAGAAGGMTKIGFGGRGPSAGCPRTDPGKTIGWLQTGKVYPVNERSPNERSVNDPTGTEADVARVVEGTGAATSENLLASICPTVLESCAQTFVGNVSGLTM